MFMTLSRIAAHSLLSATLCLASCAGFKSPSTVAAPSGEDSPILRIEAEDYDTGGEGISYHDLTPGNTGEEYRNDGVDIEACFDGGYNVGWVQKSEWLQYSGIEGDGRTWHLRLRTAAKDRVGQIRVEINGQEALSASVQPTGGFQVWATSTIGSITLPAGPNTIRLVFEEGMWNLDWFELSKSPEPPDSAPRRSIIRAQQPGAPPAPAPRENPRVMVSIAESSIEKARAAAGEGDFKIIADPGNPPNVIVVSRLQQVDAMKVAGVEIISESRDIPYKYLLDGWMEFSQNYSPYGLDGAIISNQGYLDSAMTEALLRAYHAKYPGVTSLHEIGRTWQDKPVWALKISANPDVEESEPAILFNGAHHGSELLSSEFVIDQIHYILTESEANDSVGRWVRDYEFWCIPLVNPDGRDRFLHHAGAGRKNGRDTNENGVIDATDGVDLNRNYPFRWNTGGEKASHSEPAKVWYRGPEPASEPETRAMMQLAEAQRFVAAISWHTVATKILVPYTIDGLRNPEPSVAWMIGERMAALSDSVREDRAYQAVRNLYSVDGVDQDWLYWQYGTIAYIWEGPQHNPNYAALRDKIIEGARPGWIYLINRIADEPTVSGVVVDAETGQPLEAVVRVEEIAMFEGERHSSHPESGRFDRMLPEPGEYHLTAGRDGYTTATIAVQVGQEWVKDIEIKLSKP